MRFALTAKRAGERALWALSPRLCVSAIYWKRRGHLPNLADPKDLSEIVLADIVSGQAASYSRFVDKLTARDFFEELGLGQYLPKLYAVWDDPSQIDFERLPETFALKTNHSCGSHVFCRSREDFDAPKARKVIREAMALRPGRMEPQYAGIVAKCYAEELVDDLRGGGQPLDYKFMTCDGEVKCILVCGQRDVGTKLATYSPDWKRLDYVIAERSSEVSFDPPDKLEEMLSIATKIADRFSHVRVDLYCTPSQKIFLGEVTFTPEGGYMRYFTNEGVRMMGRA